MILTLLQGKGNATIKLHPGDVLKRFPWISLYVIVLFVPSYWDSSDGRAQIYNTKQHNARDIPSFGHSLCRLS